MKCYSCNKEIEMLFNAQFHLCPNCNYLRNAITDSEILQAKNIIRKRREEVKENE